MYICYFLKEHAAAAMQELLQVSLQIAEAWQPIEAALYCVAATGKCTAQEAIPLQVHRRLHVSLLLLAFEAVRPLVCRLTSTVLRTSHC